MNIVVAMAGEGSRFIESGHVYPKPLIRTGNTTMIQNVYYSLEWPDADWHFVVKMQHLKDYPFMKSLLESMGSITTHRIWSLQSMFKDSRARNGNL